MAGPLDPATLATCRSAAAALATRETEFVDHLRASFADIAGFRSPAATAELVGHSILRAAIGQDSPDGSVMVAQQAGRELFLQGFDPAHAQRVCRSILDALRDLYPREWDSAASSSWIGVFFWVSARWAEGAAVAQRAGEQPVHASSDQDIGRESADGSADPTQLDDDDLDDDEEPTAYGGIMLSMTRGRRESRDR